MSEVLIKKLEKKIRNLKKRNKALGKENHELYQSYFKKQYEIDSLKEEIIRLHHKTDRYEDKIKSALAYEEEIYRKASGLYQTNFELKLIIEKLKSNEKF